MEPPEELQEEQQEELPIEIQGVIMEEDFKDNPNAI
jgi:hypothetical protein